MDDLFFALADAQNPGPYELSDFTQDVVKFLKFVVDDPEFAFLWKDNPELRQMAETVVSTDVPDAGVALRDAIPGISAERLGKHGLRGRPLRFKFNVIAAVARKWNDVKGQFSIREWFKRMVDAIDAVLDSLIDAAAGVGGLIKEFKDALAALVPIQE
jgi:hypothetical protein